MVLVCDASRQGGGGKPVDEVTEITLERIRDGRADVKDDENGRKELCHHAFTSEQFPLR